MTVPHPPVPPAIVIDTNVVLDWLVFADPAVAALSDAVQTGTLRWIACDRSLAELQHVLTRAEISEWKPDVARIDVTLRRFAGRSPAPPSALHLLRCTDADDQKFLDLALAAGASWLFTRDKALLRLARRARPLGLRIATPRDWSAAAFAC